MPSVALPHSELKSTAALSCTPAVSVTSPFSEKPIPRTVPVLRVVLVVGTEGSGLGTAPADEEDVGLERRSVKVDERDDGVSFTVKSVGWKPRTLSPPETW